MKKCSIALLTLVLLTIEVFGQENASNEVKQRVIENGIGLGSVIAVVTSWERNKSVLWAIIHGILSWLYVIYFLITRNKKK